MQKNAGKLSGLHCLAEPSQSGLLRLIEIEFRPRWPRIAAGNSKGGSLFDNRNQATLDERAQGCARDFERLQRIYGDAAAGCRKGFDDLSLIVVEFSVGRLEQRDFYGAR